IRSLIANIIQELKIVIKSYDFPKIVANLDTLTFVESMPWFRTEASTLAPLVQKAKASLEDLASHFVSTLAPLDGKLLANKTHELNETLLTLHYAVRNST